MRGAVGGVEGCDGCFEGSEVGYFGRGEESGNGRVSFRRAAEQDERGGEGRGIELDERKAS